MEQHPLSTRKQSQLLGWEPHTLPDILTLFAIALCNCSAALQRHRYPKTEGNAPRELIHYVLPVGW